MTRRSVRSPHRMMAVVLFGLLLLSSCGGDKVTKPPVCQLSPFLLDFGNVPVGQTKELTFTIKNTGGGTLSGEVTESCPAYAFVSGGGNYSLAANEEKAVTVRFAPATLGLQTCTVSLGAINCASAGCSGTGVEPPPVCQITPMALDFASVQIGQTMDLTFTVKNTGGGTLSGDVSESCPAYSIQSGGGSFSLAANEEKTATVRFAPTTAGLQSCTVSLGATVCDSVECTGMGTTSPPPDMVLIPAGTFIMGSPPAEPGRSADETQYQVTLTKSVYVAIHEVTQTEWRDLMGWNESYFEGANHPVEEVNWYDAVSYCNQLSIRDGYSPAYTIIGAAYSGNHINSATVTWNQLANGYRLLTEAEWEYACRATSVTAFCNGGLTNATCSPLDPNLGLVGWYCGNASGATHEVGGKAANAWGLYDMHGNVLEWCWDWYETYPIGSGSDPIGPDSGTYRAIRGGGWNYDARNCRSADRFADYPNYRYGDYGLRLARTAP